MHRVPGAPGGRVAAGDRVADAGASRHRDHHDRDTRGRRGFAARWPWPAAGEPPWGRHQCPFHLPAELRDLRQRGALVEVRACGTSGCQAGREFGAGEQALQACPGAGQPDPGRVGVHPQHGPCLRRRQPVAADQSEKFAVFLAQRRHAAVSRRASRDASIAASTASASSASSDGSWPRRWTSLCRRANERRWCASTRRAMPNSQGMASPPPSLNRAAAPSAARNVSPTTSARRRRWCTA